MGTKHTFELKLLSEVPLHTSPMSGKTMVYISWDLSFIGEVPCVPWAKGHEARNAGAPRACSLFPSAPGPDRTKLPC